MLEEMLATSTPPRGDESVRVLVVSSTDHMSLSAGADVREQLDEDGRVRRMQLFADLYDELTGFPKPTVAACHGACVGGGAEIAVACDLRVGGLEPPAALPGGRARRPGRPRPTGHPLRPLGGEVPAADGQGGRRRAWRLRWGLVHKVAPAAATEEPPCSSRPPSPSNPPEAVARLKRMLHEWDGVEDRSRVEGEGQVEWQRSGPGLPYRD